ncbi:Calvin cycle protein CP12 [Synechococcus sp. PCC 7336]|uniref:Calvin cycle protein CP12 n=1 Tax=Synechococcus sp. PCC 7336 TaxID=195250 RepID=UPI00034DC145|nr:Calvin cycle protein CP12 [Synechococcus sp. PCC 7336]
MTTTLQDRIQTATEEARAICEELGSDSPKCRAAWDAVEELTAEASHQKATPKKSPLEVYCDENPDASECLIYDD